MRGLRARLLVALAGGDSVVLNTTINAYEDGTESEFVALAYKCETLGAPVLEVRPGGALVAYNTFRIVDGKADRFVNM